MLLLWLGSLGMVQRSGGWSQGRNSTKNLRVEFQLRVF